MENNKHSAQINMDLYYYEHMHRRQPEMIFISSHLWGELVAEDCASVHCSIKNGIFYKGVPVKVYMSGKLEYYFASSGFVFEDEE